MKRVGISGGRTPTLDGAAILARLKEYDLKLILNSSAVFVIKAGGIALLTIVTAILTRSMGVAEYGKLAYVMALSYLLVVVTTLGLPSSVIKYLPRYLARNRSDEASRFFGFSLLTLTLAGLIVVPIVTGTIQWLGIGRDYNFSTMEVLGFVISLSLMRFLGDAMRALGRPLIGSSFEHFTRAVMLAMVVGWLAFGYHLDAGIALSMTTISSLVMSAGLIWYAYTRCGLVLRPPPLRRPLAVRRIWLSTSAVMMITPIFYYVMSETDILLLGIMTNPAQVAIYQIARRLAELVSFCSNAAIAVCQPKMSASYTSGRRADLQRTIDVVNLMSVPPAVAVGLVLVLGGNFILGLFGSDFQAGKIIAVIIVGARIGDQLFGPAAELLMMTGHHRYVSKLNVTFGVINIALNIALIPSFGATGAAIATAVSLMGWKLCVHLAARRLVKVETCILLRLADLATRHLWRQMIWAHRSP